MAGKYGWARAGFKVDTMRHNVQVFMPFGVQHAMALRYAWESKPRHATHTRHAAG